MTAPSLLTIADQIKWEAKYADELTRREEDRDRGIRETEAARFEAAEHAIICALRPLRKRGLSLNVAGATLVRDHGRHFDFSYTDLLRVLKRLGFVFGAAKPERSQWEPHRV